MISTTTGSMTNFGKVGTMTMELINGILYDTKRVVRGTFRSRIGAGVDTNVAPIHTTRRGGGVVFRGRYAIDIQNMQYG